jgi:hypothetical protein
MRILVPAALCLLAASPCLGQSEMPPEPVPYSEEDATIAFYVATNGNDSVPWFQNNVNNPFRTIDRARLAVREFKAQLQPNEFAMIQVRIAAGQYPVQSPIVFTAEDSGWPQAPIQYVGWDPVTQGPGDPLVSGGIVVTGWTLDTTVGAYKAVLPPGTYPEIRDLYVNNQRMIRARFPNPQACTASQSMPNRAPEACQNIGFLQTRMVQAPLVGADRYQWVTARVVTGSQGIPAVLPADWSHVEAVAHSGYVNPHQRVESADVSPDGTQVVLKFKTRAG